MRRSEKPRSEIARALRFLRERDLCRIEWAIHHPLDFNDFVGARGLDALPVRALQIARATSTESPMLAASYLRELVPPTSLDELLAFVDQLLAEVSPVWRQPRNRMTHDDMVRLEELLGRPLVLEDLAVATCLETLTPHVRANVQQLAMKSPVFAWGYLHEVVPVPHEQRRFKRFIDQLGRECHRSPPPNDYPIDN